MSLLNSIQALEVLGLYNPNSGYKPNTRYLTNLVKRELLMRIAIGQRSFRYDSDNCEQLINKVKNEGLSLTEKPL